MDNMIIPVRFRRGLAALALALAVAAFPGCTDEVHEPGVVARVNGKPVLLRELQAGYDLRQLRWAGKGPSSVTDLKVEYREILDELIIEKLVFQELERLGFGVTDEEVREAEEETRADYPDDAFEQVLVEEYIDIAVWRERLRARLAQEKFFREVLRPTISIDYQEAEDYYRNNLSDFYLPARVVFAVIAGPRRDAVGKAAVLFRETGDVREVTRQFEGIKITEHRVREDMVPQFWGDDPESLESGMISKVVRGRGAFECALLLEVLPPKVLEPSAAYPLVEKVLLEQKLGDAYELWLETALAEASISVTTHLLPADDEKKQGSAGAGGNSTSDMNEG